MNIKYKIFLLGLFITSISSSETGSSNFVSNQLNISGIDFSTWIPTSVLQKEISEKYTPTNLEQAINAYQSIPIPNTDVNISQSGTILSILDPTSSETRYLQNSNIINSSEIGYVVALETKNADLNIYNEVTILNDNDYSLVGVTSGGANLNVYNLKIINGDILMFAGIRSGDATFVNENIVNGNLVGVTSSQSLSDGDATVINNSTLMGRMYAVNLSSTATNEYNEKINLIGDYGMVALNQAGVYNEGIISNTGDVGMYIGENSQGVNAGTINNSGNVGVFNDGYFLNLGTINPQNSNGEDSLYAVVSGENNVTIVFMDYYQSENSYNPIPNEKAIFFNCGGRDVIQ